MRIFSGQGRDGYLCRTADCPTVQPKGCDRRRGPIAVHLPADLEPSCTLSVSVAEVLNSGSSPAAIRAASAISLEQANAGPGAAVPGALETRPDTVSVNTSSTRRCRCCSARADPRPCGRWAGACRHRPTEFTRRRCRAGMTGLGAALPGDAEPVATAVERAWLGLDGAGAVDHGELVVGERGDYPGVHGRARLRPGAEVGQRKDPAPAAWRLRDPLGAGVGAGGAALGGREAVGRVGGVGEFKRVAGAAADHRGTDAVSGPHGAADDLDAVGREQLPPREVGCGAVIALGQRAVLLHRAAGEPIDPDPEDHE